MHVMTRVIKSAVLISILIY